MYSKKFSLFFLLCLIYKLGRNGHIFAFYTRSTISILDYVSCTLRPKYSPQSPAFVGSNFFSLNPKPLSSQRFDDYEGPNVDDVFQKKQDDQLKLSLIRAHLNLDSEKPLIPVNLAGKADLRTGRLEDALLSCAVLMKTTDESGTASTPAILVPLHQFGESQWKLLHNTMEVSSLQRSKPGRNSTSLNGNKGALLSMKALIMNRDGGLFDNLPFATWSVDPSLKMRDAADNPVLPKFHLGKRRAFNRLLTGKDNWSNGNKKTSSPFVSLGFDNAGETETIINTINNLREQRSKATGNVSWETDVQENKNEILLPQDDDFSILSKRILDIKLKEIEMEIAEIDYEIAIARQDQNEWVEMVLENRKQNIMNSIDKISEQFHRLRKTHQNQQSTTPKSNLFGSMAADTISGDSTMNPLQLFFSWIKGVASSTAQSKHLTTTMILKEQNLGISEIELPLDLNDSNQNPFAIMRDIISEQLNAEVIGAVLENTSHLSGTLTLGGLLVLRRLSPLTTMKIAGESVSVRNTNEDFGNFGLQGGETILIECDADEAIGMSIVCHNESKLWVESDVWEKGSIMVRKRDGSPASVFPLSTWEPLNPELSILQEGQALNESLTERISPVRIPRTSLSLFDSMFGSTERKTKNSRKQLYPTDNPITSLSQYDELSNEAKAKTLMALSNFNGKLPRPRTLRIPKSATSLNELDKLLLPLIDEAVRNQILLRDSIKHGDMDRVRQMEESKSKRQIVKEKAEKARESGMTDEAERLEDEAKFLESLRADVTQDDGSYSRFLDRDEWYEKNRLEQARKIDRKKFGTLLDGIE